MNRFPMEGVEVWQNHKNKFTIFQLHYSANAAKKDPSYRDAIKSAMPIRQYMQEYELRWDSYAGSPVYADFNRLIHGVKESIEPELGLPLVRGWDFGLTPACVVAQYVDRQLRVIWEYTEINKSANTFVPEALSRCRIKFPNWSDNKKQWVDCIDPSGAFRKDTDMGTCQALMMKHGLGPIPGPVAFEERKHAVESFLVGMNKGVPNFQISLTDCPILVRGFEGGYRYDEKAIDVEPNKVRPIKDEHSHPHDALQYVCSQVKNRRQVRSLHIPSPVYWNHEESKVIKE